MSSARERRRGRRVTRVLLVVTALTTSGCGFLDAMAHPDTAPVPAVSSADGTVAPAPPPVRYPVPLAVAVLTGAGSGAQPAVSADQVRTGIGPSIPQAADDCGLAPASLQTVPIVVTLST